MRQMVGEELNLRPQDIAAIELIEGDTALTPDQGPTAGSTGVMRGGVQLRQAAATAREALLGMAAQKLNRPAAELTLEAGAVTAGTQKLTIAELVGDRTFNTKLDPKAPLKNPQRYTVVGQSLPRPDIPAKLTGRFMYVHDFKLPDMLHARVIRPAAVGAKLLEVDEASIKHIPGARVVRQQNFLAVVAPDEWAAVRAAKALKARWSEGPGLVGHQGVKDWALKGPFAKEELTTNKGNANALAEAANAPGTRVVKASFVWPVQSHASMGPSAAVADVRADKATVWSASQGTHRYHAALCGRGRPAGRQAARALPRRRRLLRHERPRRRRGRCGAAVQGRRPAGARAVVARRRTRLGPQGPAAGHRDARRARRAGAHRRLGSGDVGADAHGAGRRHQPARARWTPAWRSRAGRRPG